MKIADLAKIPSLLALSLLGAAASIGAAHAASYLDTAKEIVSHYRALPKFTPPGPSVDARKCTAGKSLLAIPFMSAVPFAQDTLNGMKSSAEMVGVKMLVWENQGQPTQWGQGISYGISQHVSLIDAFEGVNPAVVLPQVMLAKAAGIPITINHFYDYSQSPPPQVASYLANNFALIGRIMAAWVVARTEGHANILVIGSDEIIPTIPLVAAIKKLVDDCPGCKMSYRNVPVTDWATKIQPTVQSSLLADKSINYVIPIYDSMAQFVVPGITLTGNTDKVKVVTFNGTPFVLDLIRQGKVEMDLGESPDWLGRLLFDHDMRLMCGMTPTNKPVIPYLIFDKTNVATAGVPAKSSTGYGVDYVHEFARLWQVKQ